jgi:hypothetical protein
LCLLPPLGSAKYKPIHLESKLESKLTKRQLRKYRDHGAKVLVAITKQWPEVPQSWLDKNGIRSLRWQDVCRALRKVKYGKQIDRFLCDGFASYLEASEMAYRENITQKDLERVRSLFAKIARPQTAQGTVPRRSFLVANDCVELLDDVWLRIRERVPKLSNWSKWGPGYYQVSDEDGAVVEEHTLAFELYPTRKYEKQRFECYLCFPVAKKKGIYIYLGYLRGDKTHIRSQLTKKLLSNGSLDAQKIANLAVKAARDWSV